MSAATKQVPIRTIDRATQLANQLEAMLVHAYGTGGEAFRGMSDEIQDNYLWLAADLAAEMVKLLEGA